MALVAAIPLLAIRILWIVRLPPNFFRKFETISLLAADDAEMVFPLKGSTSELVEEALN